MHKIDVAQLKNDTDVYAVIEALGLQTEKRGLLMSILCPSHNDQHFGSCFISEKGYKCYSCGAHGDIIKLVQASKDVSFPEAIEFIAHLNGGSDKYQISDKQSAWHPATISSAERKAIGLPSDPVFVKVAESHTRIPEYNSGAYRTELMPDSAYHGAYRYSVMQLAAHNPMRALQEANPAIYRKTIQIKCDETIAKYTQLSEQIQSPEHCNGEEQEAINALIARIGRTAALAELNKLIAYAQKISEKHIRNKAYGNRAKISGSKLKDLIKASNCAFLEDGAPF
jgi:hypothetical protein